MTQELYGSKKDTMYICVAGNIGVGKTTLVKLLSEHLGWNAYLEPVAQNPFLDDFYRNPSRWSFSAQTSFLLSRFKDHQDIHYQSKKSIMDRSIMEDGEVFARVAFESGWMSHREYQTYRGVYETLKSFIVEPGAFIYLRCSVKNLLKRISKRSRDCEIGIDPEYLVQLQNAYEDWVKDCNSPILVLDTDSIDYSEDRKAREEILSRIENFLALKSPYLGLRRPEALSS